MARVGFKMQLRPGNEAEYHQRHGKIWPDLADLLQATGIRNYTIYRDGLTLFACMEIDDPTALEGLAEQDLMKKWWEYMSPLMECNDDHSPTTTPLEEAFHMD